MADLGLSTGPLALGQAQDSQKVPVTLVDETNYRTLETGVSSPTIQLSKNGASFASASDGTWAEVGNGDYTVTLNANDTDTLGWLILRVIKSSVSAETKVHVECRCRRSKSGPIWCARVISAGSCRHD